MSSKMNHPLITVDGRTLMDRPLEPPNFVVDTLISQGLHIPGWLTKGGQVLACSMAGGDSCQGRTGLEHDHQAGHHPLSLSGGFRPPHPEPAV